MMTSIILDTHYFYWYVNQTPNKLSSGLSDKIEQAENVYISAISCLEMAMLVQRKRIILEIPYKKWYDIAVAQAQIEVLPITDKIAHLSVDLPLHHKDPHDRIIIATALYHKAHLASMDRKFALYDELSDWLI